jgi:CheY-like chemotaxis protein
MYLSEMVRDAWKAGATKCLSKTYCTHLELLEVVRTTLANNAASLAAAGSTDSTVTALPPPISVTSEADAAFQADLRHMFIEGLPARMGSLRMPLQAMIKAGNETARLQHLYELQRRMRALTGTAGSAGMIQIARMSEALEALLQELFEKPQNFNASTRRTVASAIDFLGFLAESAALPQREIPPANILAVDDDTFSRRAITRALEKARLKCVSVDAPHDALKLLTGQDYDLVILDVIMPRMNGFELCTKLRALPGYKKTPVIFVTSLNDLESRAASTMSGGNDFIAKPFMFMELAVKVLIPLLRGKLDFSPRPAP